MPFVCLAAFTALMWAGATGAAPAPGSRGLLISAATSLIEALTECGAAFEARTGREVSFNFAASNALARQIAQGAPVDVFVSADERQMDFARRAGTLLPGTESVIASNALVVVVPGAGVAAWTGAGAIASPRIRRLAIGDPQAVPAGVYAKQWLERVGLWTSVKDRIVPTGTVRGALTAVANAAVDAAIVYRTDARAAQHVSVVFDVSGANAPRIVYLAALTRQSREPQAAREFLEFLLGEEGQRILSRHGFGPPPSR